MSTESVSTESISESAAAPTWTPVCRLEEIEVEGGVTALVAGEAVAVLRTHDDAVYAIGNYDPIGGASVLSRGIVGTRSSPDGAGSGDVAFVASPLHKQAFALRDGRCLDDAAVRVPTWAVEVRDGVVHVGARCEADED